MAKVERGICRVPAKAGAGGRMAMRWCRAVDETLTGPPLA